MAGEVFAWLVVVPWLLSFFVMFVTGKPNAAMLLQLSPGFDLAVAAIFFLFEAFGLVCYWRCMFNCQTMVVFYAGCIAAILRGMDMLIRAMIFGVFYICLQSNSNYFFR